jgi:hypothetical protein
MKTTIFRPTGIAFVLAFSLFAVPASAGNGASSICGDVDAGGSVVATDALLVLSTAVGSPSAPALVCPVDTCGDGMVATGEDCDQADLNGATCTSQGMFGNGLACAAGCVFDTAACAQARFVDNGDGTVTDNQTGLVWERKTDDDSVHDKDNTYTWSATGTAPDGQAFVDFLGTLNACVEAGGYPPADLSGGFAGHCDWRLPSIVELQTIVDTSVTGCGSGAPCIDPIFGPTINYNYWTATSFGDNVAFAWFADFDVGQVEEGAKSGAFSVRAVRTPN